MLRLTLLWLLGLAALAYAAACTALLLGQRALIFQPQPRALRDPAATMHLPVDGADLVVTVRELPGAPALIYFGGNAEDVSLSLPDLARLFPGHALYLPHYRGYGGSSGQPGEQALVADALALMRQVQARHPQVDVIGRSLGTGVAVQLAHALPPRRLVLVTPFDCLADAAARQFPWVPVYLLLRERFDSGAHAAALQMPVTVFVAEHDELIPHDSTARLFARWPAGQAQWVMVPGADHNSILGLPAYQAGLQQALR